MSPGIPRFRKSMTKDNHWARSLLSDLHTDSVCLNDPMSNLAAIPTFRSIIGICDLGDPESRLHVGCCLRNIDKRCRSRKHGHVFQRSSTALLFVSHKSSLPEA